MLKTFRIMLQLIIKDIRKDLLKSEIIKKERSRTLSLWERRELIYSQKLMETLEEQQRHWAI